MIHDGGHYIHERDGAGDRAPRFSYHGSGDDHGDANQLLVYCCRMLEMSVEEELVLTETQFSSYVMNEWDWMHSFAAGNAMYSAKAAETLASF